MNYEIMQNKLKVMLMKTETISEKKSFVDGVIELVEHKDDLKQMYEWLCSHPDADETEILWKALDLNIPRTEPERVLK